MTEVLWYGWHTLDGSQAIGLDVAGTALRVKEDKTYDQLVDGLAILQEFCRVVSEPPDLHAKLDRVVAAVREHRENLKDLEVGLGPADYTLWRKVLGAEVLKR